MSKLYFHYGTMNAGKSVNLIKDAHNYEEVGRVPIVLKPKLDSRGESGFISCRIEGMKRQAILFEQDENLFDKILPMIQQLKAEDKNIGAIFIDEAQFLTKEQVFQLSHIPDFMKVPVMAYGLRTNAFGELFEGSKALFELADSLKEIKTMCFHSDKKATMVYRMDKEGNVVTSGETIEIGGNDTYRACSRKVYKEKVLGVNSVANLVSQMSPSEFNKLLESDTSTE